MANLTRANVESVLIRRCATLLTKVGLDGVTQNGTNADLNDPIRRAVRDNGMGVSDPVTVTDTDLSSFSGWVIERLYDSAELRLLETIWGHWAEVSQTISHGKIEAQQLADRIQKRIEALETRLRKPYGQNVGIGSVGRIAHGRCVPNDPRVVEPNGWF